MPFPGPATGARDTHKLLRVDQHPLRKEGLEKLKETALSGKHLTCEHDGQSYISRTHAERSGMVVCLGEAETGKSLIFTASALVVHTNLARDPVSNT